MSVSKIITLSNFLRKEGMLVSIRSTITASRIWEEYHELADYDELKLAIKCIYVKNKEDSYKFDNIYDQLFKKVRPEKKKNNESQHIKNNEISSSEMPSSNNQLVPEQESVENKALIKDRKKQKVVNDKLTNDSIASLDEYDKRVFDICQRLSKKIANQRSKRKKRHTSHNINMPATIRYNLKNGGHLVTLIHQKPPMRKTKQIFLSDISGSCEWISTWFFAILYGCYKSFDKITVYDFDNKIVDVTPTLGSEFKNAHEINFAHQKLGVRPFGQSDMTNSFKEFLDQAELNKHTDVILLTDCRDWNGKRENGVLESAEVLHQIVIKSRKVIILNPEKKIRWNTPTSCVKDYQEAGATVYQTSTLREFSDVIEKI